MPTTRQNSQNGYRTPRNESLAPEEIVPEQTYALTFSPPDDRRGFDTAYKGLQRILREFAHHQIDIVMYPEYSKLGRLHMHGMITFNTPIGVMQFYDKLAKVRDLCTFKLDHINDGLKWLTYIRKQEPHMKPYCQMKEVPYKLKNKYYTDRIEHKMYF